MDIGFAVHAHLKCPPLYHTVAAEENPGKRFPR
jgi:hypothetical protein